MIESTATQTTQSSPTCAPRIDAQLRRGSASRQQKNNRSSRSKQRPELSTQLDALSSSKSTYKMTPHQRLMSLDSSVSPPRSAPKRRDSRRRRSNTSVRSKVSTSAVAQSSSSIVTASTSTTNPQNSATDSKRAEMDADEESIISSIKLYNKDNDNQSDT